MGRQGQEKRTQRALAAHGSLMRATESLAALQSDQLRSLGLTMGQFRMLAALHHHGPLSLVALCQELASSHSNASFVVGNLYKRGLVVRKASEGEHGSTMIRLTAEGQKLIARVFPVHATLVRAQMSVLVGREQETLWRLCVKLGRTDAGRFVREFAKADADEQEKG